MILERTTVSRKTPGDGRLEISEATMSRLEPLGARFDIEVLGAIGTAHIEALPCTCSRGASGHVHYFVSSDALKQLSPAAGVDLDLDPQAGRLRVDAAPA